MTTPDFNGLEPGCNFFYLNYTVRNASGLYVIIVLLILMKSLVFMYEQTTMYIASVLGQRIA
jgi:hypothetical protein